MSKKQFPDVNFVIPERSALLKLWDRRGAEWLNTLEQWTQSPDSGQVFKWTTDRYYEVTYLWNELKQTAVGITRWYINEEMIPFKITDKAPDGTGHRGSIDGMIRRMQKAGILDKRQSYPEDRIKNAIRGRVQKQTQEEPATQLPLVQARKMSDILAERRRRAEHGGATFDNLSREARGLPSADIANEQHPDYPKGFNRDAVHRMEHGRTNIYSLEDRKRLRTWSNLLDIVKSLGKIANEKQPSLGEYDTLTVPQKDLIHAYLRRTLPAARNLIAYLETLPSIEPTDLAAIATEGDEPDLAAIEALITRAAVIESAFDNEAAIQATDLQAIDQDGEEHISE